MIITIYKCDLCQTESKDAKAIYEAKNGLCLDIKGILQVRYKFNEICKECFDKVQTGIHNAIMNLKK